MRLLDLRVGIAIGHDAPTCEIVTHPIFYGQNANGHGKAKAAVLGQVTQRPCVKTSPVGLQLGDQLHGSYFGGPRDASARQQDPQQFLPADAVAHSGLDGGLAMVNRGMRHDVRRLRHPNASRLREAPQVIALDIDDHGKFRSLFFARVELVREMDVPPPVG